MAQLGAGEHQERFERLLESVAHYTDGAAPEDDRTLVVMRFRAAAEASAPPRSVSVAGRSAAS